VSETWKPEQGDRIRCIATWPTCTRPVLDCEGHVHCFYQMTGGMVMVVVLMGKDGVAYKEYFTLSRGVYLYFESTTFKKSRKR